MSSFNRIRHTILFVTLTLYTALSAGAAHVTENSILETVSLNETGAGRLLFQADNAPGYAAAVSQNSSAEFNINGMIATVQLQQTFTNHTPNWQQGLYVFPLPDDSAVSAMTIRIGDRLIEGEIREKKQAQAIYAKARQEGRKASLVEQQRPNMFTNAIANIGPGERIEVTISYQQAVQFDSGVFSVRLPTTITPRYSPGLARGTHNTSQHIPQSRLDATLQQITIRGRLDMGMPLQSVGGAYHQLVLQRSDHSYQFSLQGGATPMTRDFVLHWQPEVGHEPAAALFAEAAGDATFAMLMLLPPQPDSDEAAQMAQPREQIFVVDTSGSMAGVSIQQARASLMVALDKLKSGDYFNIVEFDSSVSMFAPEAVPATPQNIARARQRVAALQADGGTEMHPALQLALNQKMPEATLHRLRQIIFITDGAVNNEKALFRVIEANLGSARLFTVGIGSAPNSHFMRKASHFGRGWFTHIGNVNEVEEKMLQLLQKLSQPAVTDLAVSWPNGVQAEMLPAKLPDLYAGEPLVITAQLDAPLPAGVNGELVVSGRTAGKQWQRALSIGDGAAGYRGVGRLWARNKIASLQDSQITGAPESLIRPSILQLALSHQLLSAYTSFVAVEATPSRPPTAQLVSSKLANTIPAGRQALVFAYPQGSTAATRSLLWSVLLLAMMLIIRRAIRCEGE